MRTSIKYEICGYMAVLIRVEFQPLYRQIVIVIDLNIYIYILNIYTHMYLSHLIESTKHLCIFLTGSTGSTTIAPLFSFTV